MQAGQLRHRITFKEINTTKDSTSGELINTPVDLATVWASVTQMSGRELVNAQQVKPDATYKVIIRYLAGVTTDDFFTFNGREFQILNVNNLDERNITHELMCKEA